jgi:CubicO group peptidase (beta-lactamase class C family)
MNEVTDRPCRALPLPWTVFLLAALLSAGCTFAHGDDPTAISSRVDEPPRPDYANAVDAARTLVRSLMVQENLPGLSVAVAVAGEIVWAEGFGWADIEAEAPVTPRTRFRIGSLAMPMTAAAVGLLHERGAVDLDAPVRSYVPAFPAKQWPVTTRQLMGNVAGIRRYGDDEEELYMSRHCAAPDEALPLFADDPLRFEPGSRYMYSNYGWTLVAAVAQSAAGEPFLEFLQREVFDPAGMQDTVLDDPTQAVGPRVSLYFPALARDPSRGVHDANDADATCFQGAGALLSTPTDVARFGSAILAGTLLRDDTLAMLQTPQQLESGASTGHGLGWFLGEVTLAPDSRPLAVFGHEGSAAGGTSSFVILPEHAVVIAVTTNVSFAKALATDAELGGGANPFLRREALPRQLLGIFADGHGEAAR